MKVISDRFSIPTHVSQQMQYLLHVLLHKSAVLLCNNMMTKVEVLVDWGWRQKNCHIVHIPSGSISSVIERHIGE